MSATSGIRVLLADDHQLFRAGLRSLLQTVGDLELVGEAADGREAVRLALAQRPDVVLMDLMMPELSGLDATARIAHEAPRSRVVVLSMNADRDSVLTALRAGATGYLVKTADPTELEQAIRTVASGEPFLSSAVSQYLDDCLKRLDWERTSLEQLKPRQREVLQLVAEGHTTKAIAGKLGLSVKTVELHRTELMKSLDIHDIASLTRYAVRSGLVSLS